MKRTTGFVFISSLLIAAPLAAGEIDLDAVLGGAVGGAAGAAVGSAVGGREGAVIGGGLGGAAGAAIATSGNDPEPKPGSTAATQVVEHHHYYNERHDNGLHRGHYKKNGKHKHW